MTSAQRSPVHILIWLAVVCAIGGGYAFSRQASNVGLALAACASVFLVIALQASHLRELNGPLLGNFAVTARTGRRRGPGGSEPPSIVRQPKSRSPSDRTSAAAVEEPEDDFSNMNVIAVSKH
jgi:hypothetical protein